MDDDRRRTQEGGETAASTERGTTAITWLGHSTVLLELDGVRLLTDPVLRSRVAHLRRVAEPVDAGAVGDVDAVLVSHLHYDHLDLPSLDRLGRALHVVVPRGGGPLLRRHGLTRVTEVGVGDELAVGTVTITPTAAEHAGRRRPLAPDTPTLGYLVTGSSRVWFAGDTDLFDAMRELAPLDVALLPISGWGARLPEGHLDPLRAAQALRLLRPRVVVPIHWGTYRQLGLVRSDDVLRAPADAFAEHAARLAPEVEVRILPVGGALELETPLCLGARP